MQVRTIWHLQDPVKLDQSPLRMASLTDSLFRLIEESELSVKAIAKKSGVPYPPLRRWVYGRRGKTQGRSNRTYDADSADAVYRVLTGKSYVEEVEL